MRAQVLGVVLALAACGTAPAKQPVAAGGFCAVDADCAEGTVCADNDVFDSAGHCAAHGKICSTGCTAQADCASLGPDFHCASGCGANKLCVNAPAATTNLPASASCASTDQCQSGLSCLELFVSGSDAGCGSSKICSTTCATDPDCAGLGAGFKCFQGCGGAKVCGKTG